MFSTPKQPMAYSSLAAPSPFPSKSLFTCLSVLDEEESPSESGSPCILLDSDDIGDRQERLKQDIKSPAHRTQRRTTDSFSQVRVCSLQALSRSSKKLLPRMSFSSPNIMRGKSNNKRPQTEKATKSRGGGGVSQNDLTNVKLEMLNMHLDTKNEEVAKLKALLQQSEQKVVLLESKMTSLEEELKQQRQPPPPILEMSFGSNFEYNTDHCSNSEYDTDQTMSHLPDEMLEDLTGQLQDKRQEIDALEDEVEQWQEQANEWKNKYQSMVEQMHNGTVSEEESVNTSNISFSVDYEKDSPRSKVEEVDGRASTDNNIRSSNDDTNSPLRRSSIDSDEKMSENGPVSKHSLRNRPPLSVSALQNVQTPERCSRRRQKTKRYTPAAAAANTVVNKVKEISTAPKTDDTSEESVEFGEVGHKFSKYFGSRWGSYNGEVKSVSIDGLRHCVYPADPNGDEYLTLEELSKTKPLKQTSHNKAGTSSISNKGHANPASLVEGSDGATDGVLQVKKNVTCHICKNRRDLCVTFHCGKHSYCKNHCEKRLGFSATDVDPTKPPITGYCPVCTLSCECSGCLRKLNFKKLGK